ncbi:MAG: DUF2911 domain-containing protein [Candidatus Hydrogenedentota bacterium]
MNRPAKILMSALMAILVCQVTIAQKSRSRVNDTIEVGESFVAISYVTAKTKGKKIWGGVVPFEKNWLDGNKKSKATITFNEDVELNGLRLPTGTYGFYLHVLNDHDWQLVFSSDSQGEQKYYDQDHDLVRIAVITEEAPHEENLKIGIDNLREEDESQRADFFVHWAEKKAVLELTMTGERRGMGLNPKIPPEIRPAWRIVKFSVYGLLNENFLIHTQNFAEDFETEFGDGGGTAAHIQLLTNLSRGGLTEDMALNLENLDYEIDGNNIQFNNIIVYSLLGTISFTYDLEKREDNWRITTLYNKE